MQTIRQEYALHLPARAAAWLLCSGRVGHRLLRGLPAHGRPEVLEAVWLSTPGQRPGNLLCASAILSRA